MKRYNLTTFLFSILANFKKLTNIPSLRALAKQSRSAFQLKIDLDCFTVFAKTAFSDQFLKKAKSQLFFILFCWHTVAVATISVQVDPSTVQLGETFRLTFSMDDPKAVGIPDLTPLQQDFTIVGTERNMSYTIINGQTHSIGQWTVLLIAKKKGNITIPSIRIGHQQSVPSRVEVTSVKDKLDSDDQEQSLHDGVMLKTDAIPAEVFINQQVNYTVKLYNRQRLLDAEYVPPRVEDALLVPLGDGRRYQTTVNGQNYTVEEQQYAIFPQKSGELKIISPSFNALVFDTVPQRIKVHAENTTLVVKPKPAQYAGKDWLPAKQLALTETYEQTNATITQGSTLLRTVTVQAAGVPAQLLPNLSFASGEDFNAYPQKPELHNTARQQELIGRADIKVTYLFNKAGRVTIPAFQLHWFNSDTGKEEIASLAARTIDVEAAKGSALQAHVTPLASVASQPTPIQKTELTSDVVVEKSSKTAWWLAGGFALAWVLTLVLWWFRWRTRVRGESLRSVLNDVHIACRANNPKKAQDALLHWATMQWPEVLLLNLQHLSKWINDPALKKELSLLTEALYSQSNTLQWRGDALWRRVRDYQHTRPTKQSRSSGLPPINPR